MEVISKTKVVSRGVPILNAGIAAYDAYRTWNQSRAQGDSAWTAGTKAAGAAVESATWPLIPLAREAFGVRPAY